MSCKKFKELMRWQGERMRESLDEAKWLLSEKAGRDVGPHAAAEDFHERHLFRCAEDWRERYCGAICDHRNDCELGAEMIGKSGNEHDEENHAE